MDPVEWTGSMISNATVDRYYYIFDSRQHRAVVMDRATGREYARQTVPRAQLITRVEADCSAGVLRQFARWCARQANAEAAPLHTAAGRLWTAARHDDSAAWQRVRRRTTDAVVLAAALGLPRGQSEAARLLAIQACTHPEAVQAALDAAHMSERWAEFQANGEPTAAARAMRQSHVDWLLDVLNAS